MESKETSNQSLHKVQMIENTDYYKYIFKKTEKIVCAVFFILKTDTEYSTNRTLEERVEAVAQRLLDATLASLQSTPVQIRVTAGTVRTRLIELESHLRIAGAARILSPDHLEVFVREIDAVLRSIRPYMTDIYMSPLQHTEIELPRTRDIKQKPVRTAAISEDQVKTPGMLMVTPSRRERVLSIIRDKGEATIRDIAESIKDCSEKTIQRELIDMIKDNLIQREGERRWSKYKLI